MSQDLVVFEGDPYHQTRAVSALSPEELRRRTLKAFVEKDFAWIDQLLTAYLHLHSRSSSPLTLRRYRYALSHFFLEPPFDLLKPARDDGSLYVRRLESEGLKPSTVSVRLAAYRIFYKTLSWAGVSQANPFEHAKAQRDKRSSAHKRMPYSEDELERLLQLCTPLERLLVLLGAHGGLRISEVLALEWRDVNLAEKSLHVRFGKGGKERYGVLSSKVLEQLVKLKGMGSLEGTRIFPEWNDQHVRYRLRKLAQAAEVNIKDRMFHSFRHYSGTRLMRQTKNLILVKEHLGHAGIQTASLYAKLVDKELEGLVGEW